MRQVSPRREYLIVETASLAVAKSLEIFISIEADHVSLFRCKDGWFGYPDCEQCLCSPAGISGSEGGCDQTTGQCPCRGNFAGRQCDSCTAGYYNYPNCFSKNQSRTFLSFQDFYIFPRSSFSLHGWVKKHLSWQTFGPGRIKWMLLIYFISCSIKFFRNQKILENI